MTRESKAVNASEVYSRRVHSPVNTNGFHVASHSPELNRVSDNFNTAMEAARQNGSDVKVVAASLKGMYAIGVSETMAAKAAVYATENMAEASIKAIHYTRTIFTDKETRERIKNNRATYKNYYKAKKEKRKTAREIKNAQKDFEQKKLELNELLASDEITKDEYDSTLDVSKNNLLRIRREKKEKLKDLEGKKKTIRKRIIYKRHSRAVKAFQHRAWTSVKSSGSMLAKYPSKAAIMMTDDMEADKLAMKGAFTAGTVVANLFRNLAMIATQAVKSIFMMLSPIMLFSLILFFGIYIIFFSPLSDEFGIDLLSDNMEISEIVRNVVTEKREQLATEILMTEPDAIFYFVKLEEETVQDCAGFMRIIARNMYISDIEIEEWLSDSNAGGYYLDYLAEIICYRLTDEEAAAIPDEQKELYVGNSGTTGTRRVITIGYHTVSWLLENHQLGELEDFYLNTTIYMPAMYSGRAFVEGGIYSD